MREILKAYQCERFEIVRDDEPEIRIFSGGGLTDAIAEKGLQPLISLLQTIQEIRAFDQGNQIIFRREDEQVRILYRWKNGTEYQQSVPLIPLPKSLPPKEELALSWEELEEIDEVLPEPRNRNLVRQAVAPKQLVDIQGQGETQRAAKIGFLEEKISQLELQLQEARTVNSSGSSAYSSDLEWRARIAELEHQLAIASRDPVSQERQSNLLAEKEQLIARLENKIGLLEHQLGEVNSALVSQHQKQNIVQDESKTLLLEQKVSHLENQLQEVHRITSMKEKAVLEAEARVARLEHQLREAANEQDSAEKERQIAFLTSTISQLEHQLQETALREKAALEAVERVRKERQDDPIKKETSEEGYTQLGRTFCERYGVVAPYVAGAMAGGIASVQLVQTMSRAGMLAFFGSGGLPLEHLQYALQELSQERNIWGCNLLHNPNEPRIEETTVDMLLHFGVRVVSASAFIRLTKALIRYRYAGIQLVNGEVFCPNQVFAKVSHPSIAERFLSPPPQNLLLELMREGFFTQEQLAWAKSIPVASALIVEGDSGGHTDSRPLSVIFPAITDLRNRLVKNYQFASPVLLGAAGGLGEPFALNAAYSMGADFVVIGSVHQSTIEAGTSPKVKELLASASIIDCAMGAAPDMFEQGAQVQVFARNNFYAVRSKKLFNIYKQYPGIFEIPRTEIERLERQIFQAPLQQIWNEVQMYWQERDPRQLERANREPKHQMALMFRWYLGQSSRWAREGNLARVKDYQIWCGPAIGAFNTWAKGSAFERADQRNIVPLAFALLDEVIRLRSTPE